jgi:shikimate kinase
VNLVLIGYRGTGKSVVARLLSGPLGLVVMGMDEEIVRRAGRSIPELVADRGWGAFRDLESGVVRDAAEADRQIIDTGGGVIERPENVAALRRNGRVFWLKATVPTILRRIASSTDRPALTADRTFTEEIAEVLARRTAQYAAAADYQIDTDTRTPEAVAAAVARYWKETPSSSLKG